MKRKITRMDLVGLSRNYYVLSREEMKSKMGGGDDGNPPGFGFTKMMKKIFFLLLFVYSAFAIGQTNREKAVALNNDAVKMPSKDVLFKKDSLEKAIPLLRTAVAIDPTYSVAYNNLAQYLHLTGKTKEALDVIEKGIEKCPHDPNLVFDKGLLLFNLGEKAKAKDLFAEIQKGATKELEKRFSPGVARTAVGMLAYQNKKTEALILLDKQRQRYIASFKNQEEGKFDFKMFRRYISNFDYVRELRKYWQQTRESLGRPFPSEGIGWDEIWDFYHKCIYGKKVSVNDVKTFNRYLTPQCIAQVEHIMRTQHINPFVCAEYGDSVSFKPTGNWSAPDRWRFIEFTNHGDTVRLGFELVSVEGRYLINRIAQPWDSTVTDANTLLAAEVMPSYPGGETARQEFIKDVMPILFLGNNKKVTGRTVASFVVRKDGTLCNVTIKNSLSPEIDREIKQLVMMMPKWCPGRQNGKLVNVRYNMPFRL